MAYDVNTKIISAPVSIKNVQDCLARSSGNLGVLISSAKIGGKITTGLLENFYSAYNIIENGSVSTDGSLIEGAIPYFNLYSNKAPSHWFLFDTGVSSPSVFTIKNKLNYFLDGLRYSFNLYDFNGYNHIAVKPRSIASINGVSQITTIDIGYIGNLNNTFRIYPEMGELDWVTIFNNYGMGWLTDPYLGIYSIKKNSSTEINITNESEFGSIALSQAQGLDGEYINALFNTEGLSAGITPIAVKVGIGNSNVKNNLFGLNLLDIDLNLLVKERPKLNASPIIIFYDDNDSLVFGYTMSQHNLFPSSDTVWDTEIPPYSGVRYSISSSLSVISDSVSLSFYVCRRFIEPSNDSLQIAIANGDAIKIKDVATYIYQGTTPYLININGTLGFTSIDDEALNVIAFVESYII